MNSKCAFSTMDFAHIYQLDSTACQCKFGWDTLIAMLDNS